jgi:hypothetical protein
MQQASSWSRTGATAATICAGEGRGERLWARGWASARLCCRSPNLADQPGSMHGELEPNDRISCRAAAPGDAPGPGAAAPPRSLDHMSACCHSRGRLRPPPPARCGGAIATRHLRSHAAPSRAAHLLGQLLDEDQGADEDVGGLQVLLEGLEVGLIAQLLQQVAHDLVRHLAVLGVDVLHRLRERRLVLRLQHDVHHLDLDAAIHGLGHDAPRLGVDAGEPAALDCAAGGAWSAPDAPGAAAGRRLPAARRLPERAASFGSGCAAPRGPAGRRGGSARRPGRQGTRRGGRRLTRAIGALVPQVNLHRLGLGLLAKGGAGAGGHVAGDLRAAGAHQRPLMRAGAAGGALPRGYLAGRGLLADSLGEAGRSLRGGGAGEARRWAGPAASRWAGAARTRLWAWPLSAVAPDLAVTFMVLPQASCWR